MRLLLLVGGGFVLLVVAFVVWRLWATYAGGRAAYLRLAAHVRPVFERLEAGLEPEAADLERFAAGRTTRKVLFDALDQYGKLHLFPRHFRNREAIAEADMVAWLNHPNELGAPPDAIELMASIPAPETSFAGQEYLVYRFRMDPPHWAASDGWMAGVAGPYPMGEQMASSARGTFSCFESFDAFSPDEHVRRIHGLVLGQRENPAPSESGS